MLTSIQAPLAGIETMGGYSGSSEQHGVAMPVSGKKALAVSIDVELRGRECCLLVLNSVTSTPQWIR